MVYDMMCVSGSDAGRCSGVSMKSCHLPGCWNVSFIYNELRDKMRNLIIYLQVSGGKLKFYLLFVEDGKRLP